MGDLGLTPEDIDTVAITHLHFDHYRNAALYPRARFLVSAPEWHYVMDPSNLAACPTVGFPREPLSWLANQAFERLELVGDEHEVAPGVTMHATPGHTPGHMVVRASTCEGDAIVVGDAFYLYEHLAENIPLGYRTNVLDLLDSYSWLRSQDAIMLPAHDYGIFERHPNSKVG